MNSGEGFKFPECWQDDVRMNSLFAPVRARSINPTDWETKLKFWESLIEQWCLFHKAPLIQINVLTNNFRRNGREPSCILEVIEHLQRNGTFVSKNAFNQKTEQSWKNWAVQVMVVNPLQWALSSVKNKIVTNDKKSEYLIHWPTVKVLGQEILNKVPEDSRGKLVDIKYVQEISEITNSECLELIVRWLFSQKLIALNQIDSNVLVKFPRQKGDNTISDLEMAYYSIEQKKKMLQKSIDGFEQERLLLLQQAKQHLNEKNTVLAKKCLRRKKAVENLLQKVGGGMENIENLLDEMKKAEMNTSILESYKLGVTSLNNYYKENGITIEKVRNTKDEVEEVLRFASEIDAGLSENASNSDKDESNEALEEELLRLLQEDQKTNKPNKPSTAADTDSLLKDLPEVPSESPSSSIDEKLAKQLANISL